MPVDEQRPLDAAIGNSVLREMYEDDSAAELTVELVGADVHARLVSDTEPEIEVSEDLHRAIGELVAAHRRAGSGLAVAVYRFVKQPSGRWGMVARYSYVEELAVRSGEVAAVVVDEAGQSVVEFPDGVVVESITWDGRGCWLADVLDARQVLVRAVGTGYTGMLAVVTNAGEHRFRLAHPVSSDSVAPARYRVVLT